VLTPLVLTSCVTTSVFAPKSSCSELVPTAWSKPIPDAAAPVQGETVLDTLKSWINFGGEQTAKKASEFERAQAGRGITQRCEDRDKAAIEKSKPKFLGVF